MDNNEFDELIAGAEDELNCASGLLQMGFLRGAVNHCYYCFFNTVRALLILKRQYSKTHKGANALFAQYYIHTGIIPKYFLGHFSQLHEQRLQADYELRGDYEEEDIKGFIKIANEFLIYTKNNFR